MKRKFVIALALALALTLTLGNVALANDPESSTMWFEGELEEGNGGYEGIIPMVDEFTQGVGDGVAGYDVYAMDGSTAWFGNDPDKGGALPPEWTPEAISDHDPFPTWDTDTPDWYQYSVRFYEDGGVQKWRVANHSGTTAENPWSIAGVPEQGVPMSGTVDWNSMYALETDVGEYLPPIDPLTHPEIPGGAATMGGGAGAWDMDWSWGSEVIPLEYSGFTVSIVDLGGGIYQVVMTPAPEPEPPPSPAGGDIFDGFLHQFVVIMHSEGNFQGYSWVEADGWRDGQTLAEPVCSTVLYCNPTGRYPYKLEIPAGTKVTGPNGAKIFQLRFQVIEGEFNFLPDMNLSQPAVLSQWVDGEWVEVLTFTQTRSGKALLPVSTTRLSGELVDALTHVEVVVR